MTNAVYPAGLPQYVETSGYAEGQPALVLRTPMEVGAAKVRRKATTAPRPFKLPVLLDGAQVGTFEDFVHGSLRGGEEPFDWVHPRTRASTTFRFRKPFTLAALGGPLWRATMDLWLLPGAAWPVIDRFLFDADGIWDLAQPPEYPAGFPEFLELDGLSFDQADLVVRSQLDNGTPQMRRRSAAGSRVIPAKLPPLTSAQVDDFEAFFDGTLKGGCMPFRWLHPRTREPQILRQVPPYQIAALSGGLFGVSLQLETLDVADFFAIYDLARMTGDFDLAAVA